MKTLDKDLRKELEKAIVSARDLSEKGAEVALSTLGVGGSVAHQHSSEEQKRLRRSLRAHGRAIGDKRNPKSKEQEIYFLVEEIAFEHWHRMLFARFLAENNLLMYPDPQGPVPVTIDECEELANSEGEKNGWDMAAKFAAQMLPQIFRLHSPAFKVNFPPEIQKKLEGILESFNVEVFKAADSLGWVYQFWQSKRKDQVNSTEVKIGAKEISSVTQLFTEPYMVSYLLDNTVGAWFAKKNLKNEDFINAKSEEELREKASIKGVPLSYLKFRKKNDNSSHWEICSKSTKCWPTEIEDIKILDPCCGSGHFLVAILQMLAPIYMHIRNINISDAIDLVIRNNIYGLEIDERCVEIAAFNLALASWTLSGHSIYRNLPKFNLACSGLSFSLDKDFLKAMDGADETNKEILEYVANTSKDADILGSLIDSTGELFSKDQNSAYKWSKIEKVLSNYKASLDEDVQELGIVAEGFLTSLEILSKKMDLVITNVPYLSQVKMNEKIKLFIDQFYSDSKGDLATVFIERLIKLLSNGGVLSLVSPQNWLFQPTYEKFRIKLLKGNTFDMFARLGPGAFETISGEVVKVVLHTIINERPSGDSTFSALDVSDKKSTLEKSSHIYSDNYFELNQLAQLKNPDSRIILKHYVQSTLLEEDADAWQGICTGDYPRFGRNFWEFPKENTSWVRQVTTVSHSIHFGGRTNLLKWQNGSGELHKFLRERLGDNIGAWVRGLESWGKKGLVISQTNDLQATLYTGEAYDNNAAVMVPKNEDNLLPLWLYCSSKLFSEHVREIDQALKVTNKTLVKVPFDENFWTLKANNLYPNGLPLPYTNDPTQWIFHGHPCRSVVWCEEDKLTKESDLRIDETVLHVAAARLLGYRWPSENDHEMELAKEQRDVVNHCEELLPVADEDGIVCIPPVRGEKPASERLINLLVKAYGAEWSNSTLDELLKSVGYQGKTLESWLRDKLFTQHSKIFQHRPFIWHVWDGLNDGFSALINYHKFDYKLLETLIYTYLGDWIKRQQSDIKSGVEGAHEKLDAAVSLKKKLEIILEGEKPCDIFVRWKSLSQHSVGWNPDLNDGVRLNIRPFMKAGDIKKKDAGILRDKPNIKWTKDRGKDVSSAPWFKLGLEYEGKEGDRINDHHLSLKDKRS
jgi:hypothetical protein